MSERIKKDKQLNPKELNNLKCFRKLLNVFATFVEQPYLINKFYKESEDGKEISFTFYVKGKKKVFMINKDKNKTFFDHLYKVNLNCLTI